MGSVRRDAPTGVRWLLLSLAFAVPYVVGAIAPSGANWGTHALGYLPIWARVGGLVVSVALLWPAVQPHAARLLEAFWRPMSKPGRTGALWVLAVAVLAFALFYSFPIRTTLYGDARTILRWDADPTARGSDWFAGLFDYRIMASKEVLTLTLHRLVAHWTSAPIAQVYGVISALSGSLVILMWMSLLRGDLARSPWAPPLAATGLLLGANQIYFGHVETYPFASFVSMSFLVAGWMTIERPRMYPLALVLLLVAIKAHPGALMFVPGFLVLTLYTLRSRWPAAGRLLAWRNLFALLIMPSLLVGAALYFFYFRSFNEPHTGVGRDFQHTFLPVLAAPPPLDRYTLQSWNHLRDLGNVLLLIGAPAIMVFAGVLLLHRRAVEWRHPRVVFALMALGYPLLFCFALNPALSMPRDWDLYALLGAPLLLALAAVLAHSRNVVPVGPVCGAVLAFGVFTGAGAALNASPARLSVRLEPVGEHVFRTYHAGSGYMVDVAQAMEPDTSRQIARREASLARLQPVGADAEYMHLVVRLVELYRARGDYVACVQWMERAARIDPHDGGLALRLADGYLHVGDVERAKSLTDAILAAKPRLFEALFLRAIAAVKERNYEEARSYLERVRQLRPDDPNVRTWIAEVDREAESQR